MRIWEIASGLAAVSAQRNRPSTRLEISSETPVADWEEDDAQCFNSARQATSAAMTSN